MSDSSSAICSTSSSQAISRRCIRTSASNSLYLDVMHSALRFLPFRDLPCITKINTIWKGAVRTLKPRLNHSIRLRPVHEIPLTCALLPHITTVNMYEWGSNRNIPPLLLSESFPSLQTIESFYFRSPILPGDFLAFPSTLRSLQVNLGDHMLKQVMQWLGQPASAQLTSLRMAIFCHTPRLKLDYSPLLSLTNLSEIEFHVCPYGSMLTSNQVKRYRDRHLRFFIPVIKAMPSIRCLSLGDSNPPKSPSIELLQFITTEPSKLDKLEELNGNWIDFTNESLRLIAKLPALISLLPDSPLRATDVSPLLSLTNLRRLSLNFVLVCPSPANLVASMANSGKLEALDHFTHPTIDSDDFTKMVRHLPLLRTLGLYGCPRILFLSAFESGPITQTLQDLRIGGCKQIRASELLKLGSLKSLEHLTVGFSFDERLALEEEVESLMYGLIPGLKTFEYLRRVDESDLGEDLEYDDDDGMEDLHREDSDEAEMSDGE